MTVNKVILVGNVGKDPESKDIQSGKVVKFTLATSETIQPKGQDKRVDTEWHNVVCFGKLADIVFKYVNKGSKVYIEGKLKTSKWQDKESGKDRYQTSIIGDKLQILVSAKESEKQRGDYDELPF